MKDQASKLREMMNAEVVKQQGVCVPVAVLSCGNLQGADFARHITRKVAKNEGKKVVLINTETEQEDLKMLIERPLLFPKLESDFLSLYTEIGDNLSHLYGHILHGTNRQEYIHTIRKIEGYKEVLFYYCGSSINAKAMNLMALSSVVILVIDATKESIQMAADVLKLQRKIQQHCDYVLIGNDMTVEELDVIGTYLKKESMDSPKVLIRAGGVVAFQGVKSGDAEETEKLHALRIPVTRKSRTLSERLERMR
ncbi:hypothetical protein CN918_27760 [Priestia megaterium]|nr:hypothetical protein CN918_27760 [Priestia megaterium]